MNQKHFDAVVIGVGGMGSAACYHLAKRGCKVLGLEQFGLANKLGSSQGESRVIRQAYYEHPNYVPLLKRSYALWEDLEKQSGTELLVKNGLVIFANPNESSVYKGTLQSATQYQIPVEKLTRDQALQRFPMYFPSEDAAAVYEPGAGLLYVEKAVLSHALTARKLGAQIHENETFLDYKNTLDGIEIRTDKGLYLTQKLILTAGPWNAQLLQSLKLDFKLHRLIQFWFVADPEHDLSKHVPCFVFHKGEEFYYGFPSLDGRTIKFASHFTRDEISDPLEKSIRQVPDAQLTEMRRFIKNCLPKASENLDRFATCLYTMTPDEDFVIDVHPENSNVFFAAGFSGHGFKFCPVIGEILADWAVTGKTQHPVDFLKIRDRIRIR